ncbi:ABC transporter ATP-binding protein [Nonomuraea sp. NPDC050404]|uniref:ABC transporter ATP-binding protein n=1 Tax=Nonomuraea sp. NPDC050404 TaxID=3155783 RepID=UPI0033F9FD60
MRRLVAERTRLLRLSFEDPRAAAGLVLVHGLAALAPAATALSTGWLVAALTGSLSGFPPGSLPGSLFGSLFGAQASVVWPLVAMAALLAVTEALEALAGALEQYLAGHVDARVMRRVRLLALAPAGMAHLEDPAFADEASRASDLGGGRIRSPGTAAVGQLRLVFRMLSAAGSAAVVATQFSVVLAVVVLALALTQRALLRRWWIGLAEVADGREELRRRGEYWSEVASTGPAAKEIRLFGLAEWVVRRRTREVLAWARTIWEHRRGILRQQWLTAVLAAASACLVLLFPGLAAVRGDLSLSALVTVLVAAGAVFGIAAMGHEAFDIEFGLGAVRALDRLTASHQPMTFSEAGHQFSAPPELRAESVGFRYPGAEHGVLGGLDLTVRPGEVLALVGHNGVGKTTLIKLLAGLYLPTTGRVLVDGQPLTAEKLAAWRRRVAVVFQDFNRYPLPAADNIAMAAPEHRDDLDGIRAAARRAGIHEVIEALPAGYDTPLTRDRSDGVDLSGGQWQRVAIARAVFAVGHGRDVLILDEPTAHLDVEAETRFYRQVVAEVPGTTVLLISHRLSTVRNADRIVLLEAGRVAEQGDHDDLLARDGAYARLFRLQAARFTTMTGSEG